MFHLFNFLKNANLSPEFLSLLKYISALVTSFCSKHNLKQKHQKTPYLLPVLKTQIKACSSSETLSGYQDPHNMAPSILGRYR